MGGPGRRRLPGTDRPDVASVTGFESAAGLEAGAVRPAARRPQRPRHDRAGPGPSACRPQVAAAPSGPPASRRRRRREIADHASPEISELSDQITLDEVERIAIRRPM